MKRARSGFTLLEMLIVATIIGLLTAILIPNLMNMIQRARQKRTMGDMHAIALAIESYNVDARQYPPAAAATLEVIYGGLAYPTASVGVTLPIYIVPTYLRAVPIVDGWRNNFLYTATTADYGIVSTGKDGIRAEPDVAGPTTNFNSDIVLSDGHFTVYPDGVPQQ
jgi:general secretion pathway protein G